MRQFKNILVGVDLVQGDQFVSDELPASSTEAVERAMWLAKENSAKLRFFYALDVSAATQCMIEESQGDGQTASDKARRLLSDLVERARQKGIDADLVVRFGKSWLETIKLALRDRHDLVVVGTRRLSPMRGFLVGSTGLKLLRLCPCPVWIAEPQSQQGIKSILVAHCLRPVGDLAMELGCEIAALQGVRLHVVHSHEFPELDNALPSVVSSIEAAAYRSNAKEHIHSQLNKYNFAHEPHVHIASERPDFAIKQSIEKFDIELLAMGTIARAGMSGVFTGNTAERLLPQVTCSVLAVKPQTFVTPVLA